VHQRPGHQTGLAPAPPPGADHQRPASVGRCAAARHAPAGLRSSWPAI